MGNFLQALQIQGALKTACPLVNLSLSKIRELHGGFKAICDNFAMNLTEFETIFTHNERTFALWDTDSNGKCRLKKVTLVQGLSMLWKFLLG